MSNKEQRIRELERELESYRLAAASFADEIVSIVIPFRAGDALGTGRAVQRVSEKHYAMLTMCNKEVH